jgi:hypothetical protein
MGHLSFVFFDWNDVSEVDMWLEVCNCGYLPLLLFGMHGYLLSGVKREWSDLC